MKKNLIFGLLTLFFIAGCNSSSEEIFTNEHGDSYKFVERVTVQTGSEPEMCYAASPELGEWFLWGLCKRELINTEGKVVGRQAGIGDFMLEMGTRCELVLDKFEYLEPYQDGPSFFWELVEVKSEQQDEVGTIYTYENVYLFNDIFRFTESEGVYKSGFYEFLCAPDTDCDTLVEMSNSGGIVNVEFSLLALDEQSEPQIYLTYWN